MVKTQRPIAPLDQITRRRGAALLLDVLRSEGVRYIFGNPGTTELPLIDALIDAPDISYIWGLQEASVVAMADGYAQAACRPGLRVRNAAGRDRRPTGLAAHHHRPSSVRGSRRYSAAGGQMGAGGAARRPAWSAVPSMTAARRRPDRCFSRCRWMSWRR